MSTESVPHPVLSKFKTWFVGLLTLSGLILLVTHFGELEHFLELLRQAKPKWLLLAFVLQFCTYVSVASVWYLALRLSGLRHSLLSLVPLGIAKLFSDQAMPSAGMSGTAFFIAALNRRGVPPNLCMATLLLSMVSYYGAYLIAALTTILLLYFYHAIQAWIVLVVVVFCVVAVGIPGGALWLRSVAHKDLPPLLMRVPGLDKLMSTIADAPSDLLRMPLLVMCTTAFHGSVFALDVGTLWVMLRVVGIHVTYWAAFPSFVLASMVATVGPIPLGLGTFEVTCVSVLRIVGVPIEAALTSTLLLRGFTLWLPMLPGMYLTRRALR